MIQFTLPIPPSVNHCRKNARAFKVMKNAKGQICGRKAYIRQVKTIAAEHWIRQARFTAMGATKVCLWTIPPADQKIVMEVRIFWPDRRRRDPDNLLKLTQDSLTGIVWHDDKMVLPRVMDFKPAQDDPRVELKIYRLPEGV